MSQINARRERSISVLDDIIIYSHSQEDHDQHKEFSKPPRAEV